MAAEPSLFQAVAADDQGGRILADILGPGWDRLAGDGAVSGAATVCHALLASFNRVALAGVCLLFVVVMIQGVAATACEGVPLGRRWSSLWMPLRFAGAMGLLAPVVKGLSIFQALILMAVGASVNVANHAWSTGVERFAASSGQLALPAPEVLAEDSSELGRGLLRALTIQEYYRQRLDLGVEGPLAPEIYWPPATGQAGGLLVLTMASPKGSNLLPGDLGRLRVPCPDPAGEMCRARLAAVRNLIAALGPLAEALADPDGPPGGFDPSLLARSVAAYRREVGPWLEVVGDKEAERVRGAMGEFGRAAAHNGWAAAGAYYWNMARLNESAGALLWSTATWTEGQGWLDGEVLEDFGAVSDRLERYLQGAYRPERAVSAESVPAEFPSLEWFNDKIGGYVGRQALSSVVTRLGQGDPVMVLAGLGRHLVSAAEAVIGLKVASSAAAKAAGAGSGSLLGQMASSFTGSVSGLVAGAAAGTVEAVGPYVVMASVLLLGYGFLLAYFLPALPFLIHLAGVLSWVVMVVEALAAAPLWVAAHALPEGDGLAGRAGRHGYLLLLSVLVRPPLMVFGFLMAMALMNGVGRVVGSLLSVFGFDRVGEGFLGVTGFLAFSVILGLAVAGAAWRLFGLAAHLPERVVAWVGAHAGHQGEIEEVRRHQHGFDAAGGLSRSLIQPLAGPSAAKAGPAGPQAPPNQGPPPQAPPPMAPPPGPPPLGPHGPPGAPPAGPKGPAGGGGQGTP